MGIIKKFKFDNVDSSTYGIGITGEAVYNSPERDVEMISIPGRNGEYALDRGRFNNIEITYPAGMGDSDQTTFASRISGLRNALASKVGYKRLEDEYNPDEFRMAIYQRGLEVSPAHYSQAGEFDITFNCKPQRFLKSGETAVSVANNGSINNPTLFESRPLLEVKGYGAISINDDSIAIISEDIGTVTLPKTVSNSGATRTITMDTSPINNGDNIYVDGISGTFYPTARRTFSSYTRTSITGYQDVSIDATMISTSKLNIDINYDRETFVLGTSRSITTTANYSISDTDGYTSATHLTVSISYDGAQTIVISSSSTWDSFAVGGCGQSSHSGAVTAYSTKPSISTAPTYIDLDIGEAYRAEGTTIISLNNFVQMGAELPTLKPGTNTITYDNTITSFKITPRWWKV